MPLGNCLALLLLSAICWPMVALADSDEAQVAPVEEPTPERRDDDIEEGSEGFDPYEGQAQGLGRAASSIFFSDKRFTFSGYAEVAINTGFNQPRDRTSGDLELFYDTLIRAAPFFGFRLMPRWLWVTELGLEFFQGAGEVELDFFPESYFDVVPRPEAAVRLGIQPLFIGYINNNEEPVLYQSVNRPEVERLIIPTEWIELGATFYGTYREFSYALILTHGPDLAEAQSPTWIRRGADTRFRDYGIATNGWLSYRGIPFTDLVLSGYWSYTGSGRVIERATGPEKFWTNMGLLSLHARSDYRGFTAIALGTVGFIQDTEGVFLLTEEEQGTGQVLGRTVYGAYIELAYDIAHTWAHRLRRVVARPESPFRIGEIAIPVFVRYERLDTHASVAPALQGEPFLRNDLHVVVAGLNFRPNHVVAIKVDGRFRYNRAAPANEPAWERLLELGAGVEF